MVFETDITKMLGIKHPIVGAPMGPFYTTDLTIAVSEAGGLGVLSHASDFSREITIENLQDMKSTTKVLKKNMEYVVEHTDKPFGFNIRTSRLQLDAYNLVKEIPKFIMENPKIKEQCVYCITSAGSSKTVKTKSWDRLIESGSQIKHFHVAPALWLAGKCVDSGVDGVVVTGTEGGGHQSYEKVSTLVLLQQVKQKYPDIPVIACGGYATGEGLASALAMGAGAVAMGSRFIASEESEFHDAYKNIVPPAKASDTVIVTGALGPIRLWNNNYAAHHGLVANKEEKMAEEAKFTPEMFIEDGKRYAMIYDGNVSDGAVLLGQSIGVINSVEKVSKIIDSVVNDAEKCLKNATNLIK